MIRGRLRYVLVACTVGVLAATGVAPAALPTTGPAPIANAALAGGVTAASTTYELQSSSDPSKPMRWLACRPVEFRINPDQMPAGLTRTVRATMAVIARQTGVRFRYAGRTDHTFDSTTHAAVPTIYFAFTRERHEAGRTFGGRRGGEIGVGGPAAAWYRSGTGTTYEAMTYGRVLLSSRFDAPRLGAGVTWESLILHEVGHALNLAHRGGTDAVMHPMLSADSPDRYTPKEVAALRRVLQTTGCDYEAWSRL